jgi:hypothetical protein
MNFCTPEYKHFTQLLITHDLSNISKMAASSGFHHINKISLLKTSFLVGIQNLWRLLKFTPPN